MRALDNLTKEQLNRILRSVRGRGVDVARVSKAGLKALLLEQDKSAVQLALDRLTSKAPVVILVDGSGRFAEMQAVLRAALVATGASLVEIGAGVPMIDAVNRIQEAA